MRRVLIVGGHDIQPGGYPYYVSIDKNNGVVVSGALIAPDIVLSAGHVALDHMDNLTIKVGPYAKNSSDPSTETLPLAKWQVYSNWSSLPGGFFVNDYMILQLAAKSTHAPIRLNRDPAVPFPGQYVKMMGLGWTNAQQLSPAFIVQEVELVTISNEECETAFDPSRPFNSYRGNILECMLCTKSPPNTSRDGCAWDSGDPVIVAGNDSREDLLVGLGSSGVGCADPIFPAIQARIATETGFAYQWIREQVCSLSVDPPKDFDCTDSSKPAIASTRAAVAAANRRDRSHMFAAPRRTVASINHRVSTHSAHRHASFFSVDSMSFSCLILALVFIVGKTRQPPAVPERPQRRGRQLNRDVEGRGKHAHYGSIET